jgi:hypothetical protein
MVSLVSKLASDPGFKVCGPVITTLRATDIFPGWYSID